MRYAIVSDVHANWQAWSAVRDDILARGVDAIVCLGDIVGYGPSPTRVVADLRKHCENFVLGNHDAAAAGLLDLSLFNDAARRSAEWTRRQFDKASLRLLGDTPLVLEDENIIFVHAETPAPDDFGYVEGPSDVLACFQATDRRFIFLGHTHRPAIFVLAADGRLAEQPAGEYIADVSERCMVNVGSVGDPGDGTDKASYCLFDSELGIIELRKVAFDTDAFWRELQQVPELATPWFLQHRGGERFRPAHDQTVPTGKVSSTPIRVTARRATIRVRSGALAADPGKVLERFRPASKSRSRKKAVLAAIAVGGVAAAACLQFWNPSPPARRTAQALSTGAVADAGTPGPEAEGLQIALDASGEELSKTNLADHAMDANPLTRWCAGDGLLGHWIRLDLGSPRRIGSLVIRWEIPDKPYGANLEASTDGRTWKLLTTHLGTGGQRIACASTSRFVRINVTKLPPQKWASICEVQLFDDAGSEMRRARTAAAPVPTAPPAIKLLAKQARLHGKGLRLENRYGNIENVGWWSDKSAFVDWPLAAPRGGVYEVEVDYSLEVKGGGNEIVLEIGKEQLKVAIRPTESWGSYHTIPAGRIRIADAPSTLAVRASKLTGGALMNLRSVTLRRVAD